MILLAIPKVLTMKQIHATIIYGGENPPQNHFLHLQLYGLKGQMQLIITHFLSRVYDIWF